MIPSCGNRQFGVMPRQQGPLPPSLIGPLRALLLAAGGAAAFAAAGKPPPKPEGITFFAGFSDHRADSRAKGGASRS